MGDAGHEDNNKIFFLLQECDFNSRAAMGTLVGMGEFSIDEAGR